MCLAGERADDIIGFVARQLQHRDVHGPAKAFHIRNRGGAILRHFFALGLVRGELDVAFGRFGRIKRDRKVSWPLVLEDVQEGIGKPQHGGGIYPLGSDDRAADKGKMSAINQRHTIKEK